MATPLKSKTQVQSPTLPPLIETGPENRSTLTLSSNPLQPANKPLTPPVNFNLPTAKPVAQKTLPSVETSVPLVGQHTLPSSFDDLQKSFEPPKEEGFFTRTAKSLGKGIADITLQPARALEQVGKFLGTIGLTPEQKKKVDEFMGPGLQEQVLGKEYATPTPETGGQAAGIALKAAANLSTPFGTSLPAMAAQGAAYGVGQALEDRKSAGDVVKEGLIGGASAAALGKVLDVGGAVVGKGFRAAANEIGQSFRPIADKLGPLLTGTSRQEFDMAFKDSPHILMDYLNTVKNSATPADAEGALQGRMLENVRTIIDGAKKTEGNAFETASKAFNDAHPDVTVDVHSSARRLLDELPSFGHPISADEEQALTAVQKILQKPRPYTVDGTRTLLQDLYGVVQRLEPGSPAERLATKAWADVRGELAKATRAVDDGAFETAMARFSDFKDTLQELRPAFNEKTSEDAARSFVRNLTGTNKTSAREALMKLQGLAGSEDALSSIEVYRLMKRLVAEGKVTGSRVQDVLISGGAVSGLGALGSLLGPGGQAAGHLLGSLLAAKTLAPKTITEIMLSNLRAQGIAPTNAIRKQLEEIITTPSLRNAAIQEFMKSNGSKEESPIPQAPTPLPSANSRSFEDLQRSFDQTKNTP